jgi:hypothetical protein
MDGDMNSTADQNIPPEELPTKTADLLDSILRQLPITPSEKPREFLIVVHAKNILALARDIIYLEAHDRSNSTPVVARTILESLFKLGVGVKNPDLAARKALLEVEWDQIQAQLPGSRPKDLAKIRKMPIYGPIGQLVRKLSEQWNFSETEYLGDAEQFTIWKWAKEAGLADLYNSRYAELSLYSHALVSSFLIGPVRPFVLAVVVLCLLESVERIVGRYNQHISEDMLRQSGRLRELFKNYHKSGEYIRLFASASSRISTPRPQRPEDKFKKN